MRRRRTAAGDAEKDRRIQKPTLVEAVISGNEADVVSILTQVGWNVLNRVIFPYELHGDEDTGTLLHVACCYTQPALVKLLVEREASVDKKSRVIGVRPLHLSAVRGDEESCALLISSGCTVDAFDVDWNTPLHWASLYGKEGAAKLLLQNGACVNLTTSDQRHAWSAMHMASYRGKTGVVQVLADFGADLNCLSIAGRTPMQCACEQGKTNTMKLLIRLGADVILGGDQTETLYSAVTRGYLKTARILISSLPNHLVNVILRKNFQKALVESSAEFCMCTQRS